MFNLITWELYHHSFSIFPTFMPSHLLHLNLLWTRTRKSCTRLIFISHDTHHLVLSFIFLLFLSFSISFDLLSVSPLDRVRLATGSFPSLPTRTFPLSLTHPELVFKCNNPHPRENIVEQEEKKRERERWKNEGMEWEKDERERIRVTRGAPFQSVALPLFLVHFFIFHLSLSSFSFFLFPSLFLSLSLLIQ